MFQRILTRRWGVIIVGLILCGLLFGLTPAASAAPAHSPGVFPDGCLVDTLPSHDPEYPTDQIIAVCMPPQPIPWNGTLVVYAHGYRPPQLPLALPVDEINQFPTMVPGLLGQGFAFATTSYHKNGYALEAAGEDLKDVVHHFNSLAPTPAQRVLLVGASEGGIITTLLVERHPADADGGLFHGGLALCAPVGGMPYQAQFIGDFRVVFDVFFPDVFPFGAADIPPDAYLSWQSTYVPAISAAMAANPSGVAQLFAVTGANYDPANPATAVVTATTLLFYNIWGTNDLIALSGGNPYGNENTIYTGSFNDTLLNASVERVAADQKAVGYVKRFYDTTGKLRVPLVTLHNQYDPAVPYQHEAIYANKVAQRGRSQYLTSFTVPTFGHCAFDSTTVLNAFGLLVSQTQAP